MESQLTSRKAGFEGHDGTEKPGVHVNHHVIPGHGSRG